MPSKKNDVLSILKKVSLGKINIIESNKNFSNVLHDIRYGKSIWRLLLIIALTCLILESIIGIPNKDRLKSYLE